MKLKIVTLFAIAGILTLAGCSPKTTTLSGQAFIVTQSAENMKLGDIQILLISKTNATAFIQAQIPTIESEIKSKQLEITNAAKWSAAAMQKYGDALTAYTTFLENPPYKKNTNYLTLERNLSIVTQLRDRFENQYDSLDEKVTSAEGDGMDSESFDNLLNQRTQAEQAFITESNAVDNFQSQIDSIESFSDEQSTQMQANVDSGGLAYTNAQDEVSNLQTALAALPAPADYFKDSFPEAVQITKTDSDGKFTFKYPINGAFTIFATAQRLVLNQTENYYWLVNAPSGIASTNLFLSNDNLASVDPDNYFPIKSIDSSLVSVTGQP